MRCCFFWQEKMQNCFKQQKKRRVGTHWIEQCQRECMIHRIGQCRSRSAEYTGSEPLSEGVHSHCLEQPSPVSSASVPPSASYQDGYDCSRQSLSVDHTVSDTLSERSISPLPPFPITAPQYRSCLVHVHSAGRNQHQPPQPAARHTPESRGPPSPTPATRRPPPSACAPADRARVGVAATGRRRGRRPAVGAAPEEGAGERSKGGGQGRVRRPAMGAAPAAAAAACSKGDRQGRGRLQRRKPRSEAGAAPAAGAATAGWVAASGGGGGQGRGRRLEAGKRCITALAGSVGSPPHRSV